MSDYSIANNWDEHPDLQCEIAWATGSGSKGECYIGKGKYANYQVRMNDFPVEPLFTLIVAGIEILHFDDWPAFWAKP